MVVFTSGRERRLWLWALGTVVAIYATLGQVPAVASALRDRNLLDSTFFAVFLVMVAALVFIGLSRRPQWREIGVGVAVVAAYGQAFLRFASPEERTHLFEFGVVAVLIYLALVERRANGGRVRAPAALAFLTSFALGWIDEGIQAILPNRFYDTRYVGFNALAVFMAIVAVASLRWARTKRRSGRERRQKPHHRNLPDQDGARRSDDRNQPGRRGARASGHQHERQGPPG